VTDDRLDADPLRTAIERALQREGLTVKVAADGSVAFAPTLGLDGEKIAALFAQALAANGLPADVLAPSRSTAEPPRTALIDDAVRACSQTRQRVVAEGSFVSGGHASPFLSLPPPMQRRGLALYRFPRRGAARLQVHRRGVRIHVPKGALGKITSVGFWLPTFIAGDFDVQMEHRLRRWRPGSGPACFALLAADRTTARTYYAQWTSEPGQRHRLGTVLGDRPLQHGRYEPEPRGTFRLRREGCLVTSWFRGPHGWWQLLGARGDDPGAPMLFGAKIWAIADSRGLTADVLALRVTGEVHGADEDPPPRVPDEQFREWRGGVLERCRARLARRHQADV
jgi:hypothetical protein